MLNIFPIQFLAPLAYTLLRLCVGLILVRLGTDRLRERKNPRPVGSILAPGPLLFAFGVFEVLAGILFFLGAFTQIAALLTLGLALLQILWPRRLSPVPLPRIFFTLLFCASLSLFITGAGAFALDMPI